MITTFCGLDKDLNSEIDSEIDHFYIKVKGKHLDGSAYGYEYGKVLYNKDYKCKLKKIDLASTNEFITYLKNNAPQSEYDLNFYIHGMWANNKMVWRETVKQISKDVFAPQCRKQIIVSYIWDAAIPYSKSVALARHKGQQTSDLTFDIIEIYPEAHRVNILAHSMGNRYFEEVVKPYLPSKTKLVDNYISIGADLEANIFEQSQPLEHIHTLCKNIIIYQHHNDRTLGVSRALNDNKRLGITGISKDLLKDSSFYLIDVSHISDLSPIKDVSNHRYYYSSSQVKKDIKEYLLGETCSQRIALSRNNHFKIIPK